MRGLRLATKTRPGVIVLSLVQRCRRSAARILGTTQKGAVWPLLWRHDASPTSRTLLSWLGKNLVGADAGWLTRHESRITGVALVVALPQAAAGKEFAVPPIALDQNAAFAFWTRFGDGATYRFDSQIAGLCQLDQKLGGLPTHSEEPHLSAGPCHCHRRHPFFSSTGL